MGVVDKPELDELVERNKLKHTTRKIWTSLVRYFVAGIIAILPLVVTVAIVTWVTSYLVKWIGPSTWVGGVLKRLGLSFSTDSTASYLLGWFSVLVIILVLGAVVELGAKSFFSRLLERIFSKIPLVGSIYRTSKQMVELLDTNNKEAVRGMSAVYCYFGDQPGHAVLAFLVSSQRFLIQGHEYYIVMIPTAPVPFGGAMMLSPIEKVQPADISVDGVMSIYLSMGVTARDFIKTKDQDQSS
jgi:uncharacterized membrane protein